jgi:hypothetical protein
MHLDPRAVVLSGLFVLVAGLGLWPPGPVYWTAVAGDIGGGPTLALVGTVAVLVGAVFQYLADVPLPSFGGGTVLAVAGLTIVAAVAAPDAVAWVVWYGLLAVCLFVGVTAVLVYRRGSIQLYPVKWA